ncbi:MAG: DUF5110 domain-containing protein, partial [Brevundimonas sp.]
MPYIYSLAGDVYQRDGTIMRGLVMDFPSDLKARDINDQYLFGHALLVAPVTEYKARSRSVYFPQGADWYDMLTGQKYAGGRSVIVQAAVDKIPVFVRAGSILPTGPAIQYTAEKLDGRLTLVIYTGANGTFSLYEDQGTTYAYERGEFSNIPMTWNEATGVLTIGARTGSYPTMPATRTINVRFVSGPGADVGDFDAAPARTIQYDGQAVEVRR